MDVVELKRLNFFKNKINQQLEILKDSMGIAQYKVYKQVVNDTTDLRDLIDIGELDLQIDFIKYIKENFSSENLQVIRDSRVKEIIELYDSNVGGSLPVINSVVNKLSVSNEAGNKSINEEDLLDEYYDGDIDDEQDSDEQDSDELDDFMDGFDEDEELNIDISEIGGGELDTDIDMSEMEDFMNSWEDVM